MLSCLEFFILHSIYLQRHELQRFKPNTHLNSFFNIILDIMNFLLLLSAKKQKPLYYTFLLFLSIIVIHNRYADDTANKKQTYM